MEDLLDYEEMVTCPYNSSHRIRKYRMQIHLVKCKKNYPDSDLVPCDFNATHIVHKLELDRHYEQCEDRKNFELKTTETLNKAHNKYVIQKIEIATDENWDDIDVPTYDPRKDTENRNVLRGINVASSSKRREFRQNERQRLRELAGGGSNKPEETSPIKLSSHPKVNKIKKEPNPFN